jgi:UTP-glucose-1-phosphate uridylyltransferase
MVSLVIMAAGQSSRYQYSKQIDKLYQVYSLMDFSIYDALLAGYEQIVLIIRLDQKQIFEEKYKKLILSGKMHLQVQDLQILPSAANFQGARAKPWGTAHCVYCVKKIVKGNFAVINCDDFYGREAFVQMQASLDALANERYFFMVSYQLKNTLSPNGSVSRGVCTGKEEKLRAIEELEKIARVGGKIMAGRRQLAENATVSMNFWGFTPFVQELIEKDFIEFLEQKNLSDNQEFYITTVIEKALKKEIVVNMLPVKTQWFGLTYFLDRELVKKKLQLLVQNQQYPSRLWQ